MIHVNVTAHPTAAWTLQQLREAIASNHSYRFIREMPASLLILSSGWIVI
jgi:hypothetical protein